MRKSVLMLPIALALCCGVCDARVNSTRKGLKTSSEVADTVTMVVDSMKVDDMTRFAKGAVVMRGYAKQTGSSKETFMLTNNTNLHISLVEIIFRYTDVKGVLLHERTETVVCDLPPYSSRQAWVKTWDEGHKFYYYKGKSRKDAIAYDVKVRVKRYDVRVDNKE